MSLRIFRKSKMQAWLLPIALVFSLFAFSGSAMPTAPGRAVTTEQVAPAHVSPKRQLLLQFKHDFGSSHSTAAPDFLQALRHYEQTVKTQVTQRFHDPKIFPEFMRYLSQYTL